MSLTHINGPIPPCSHLAWVRVIGNIKSFHNKRSVTAAHIHVVTDMAEIFYHQLETLSVHLYFIKGPLTESGALATSSGAAGGVPSDYTAVAGRGGADQYADMEPLQRQILMFMKNTITDENGSSVIEIANAVKKTGATADKISYVLSLKLPGWNVGLTYFISREAIDALTDNGFIYASIDDVCNLPLMLHSFPADLSARRNITLLHELVVVLSFHTYVPPWPSHVLFELLYPDHRQVLAS